MKRRYLPILLALLFATPLLAETITTLQLRNRPAAEIIPVIEPFLGPGDKISGHGFKIFLRASAQTVAEVEDLIANIDLAAQTLMISVFQGRESDLHERDFSGSIRIESGNISGSISASETRRSETSSPVHQLRVTEGNAGFIAMGTSSYLFTGDEVDASSGFYVLPRINGDRVTLQISPFRNNLKSSGGTIETLQANTVISGRIGEWLPLGGVDHSVDATESDGFGQRSTRGSHQDSIWIRTDLVR